MTADISECAILIVEDDPFNRGVMKRQLEAEGYRKLTFAENGRIALDKVSKETFDIILLDIEMPEMNGIEVLQILRSDLSARETPVIMISAVDAIESIAKCIAMGAEDYLLKPCDATLLSARLSACREKKRLRDLEKSHMTQIRVEKRRADDLLNVILPASIANELMASGKVAPRSYQNAAILFADIVGFTGYCDQHTAEEVVENLQKLFTRCEAISASHRMEKIKTIGDAYMAAAGLVRPDPEPLLTAVRCGLEMAATVSEINPDWALRVGVHVGPVVAGVVGVQKYQFDVWGDTVNTASRMSDVGKPGMVTMTHDSWLGVDHAVKGRMAGQVAVKGKGQMDVVECYAVTT
jgi:class 3 adenylate cyclase